MITQYVVSADGTRIAYDVAGRGSALMLLHGAGKSRQDWHTVGYVERLMFGGNIARYVGAWSDRVTAMAVVGIPFGPAVDEEFDRYIDQFASKYAPLGRAPRPSTARDKKKPAIKGQIPALLACFQAMRRWPRIEPQDVRCPTLLLVGTKNTSAMSWVKSHRDTLPGTQVHVQIIEGLNHQQEFSKIDQVFPIISSFFKCPGQTVQSPVVKWKT